MILAPAAHANLPLTQEDDNFFQQMNTFGWSFRSLHLPGPAQEAEFGRGICDDLLGEAAYPIPDGGVVWGKRRTPTTADSLYLIVLRQLHQTAVTGYPPSAFLRSLSIRALK